MAKDASPAAGQRLADFNFTVTNPTDLEVVITAVQGSCSCTTAKTPPLPWHLAGHAKESIVVSVDLLGKTGTLFKSAIVQAQGYQNQILGVTVHMSDSPEAVRAHNMQLAVADRQAVFKGDCAACHVTPATGKMGKELFIAACEVCHDPTGPGQTRSSMVPNLQALNHPTDYNFWKTMITIGKPGTLMPAFGAAAGGPLTDEQVESLATTLAKMIPPLPQTNLMKPGRGR